MVPHWGRLLLRGVMCNVLVALALWFAISAEDLPGKLMGVWAPIFLFVTCGYEHSIANMFYIPVALMHVRRITRISGLSLALIDTRVSIAHSRRVVLCCVLSAKQRTDKTNRRGIHPFNLKLIHHSLSLII